ncbi:hypothetical protein INT44_004181 [Umbelopsis vinacea]|uniref:Transmembrane protein 242 n=1 Tax=Umbelopsis vinacea TaxID=44442 RepID=A0A8H7US98_9FUNG|nr:hypothetical protein INT44_004181 [Umbelopsis vinacea]KAI9287093.1 hypothetical protein BC943DRAFT_336170 [Umbelopsis sp. AD052]
MSTTNTKKASEPPIQPKTLLAGAASAFVLGLAGSIWQANRKHAREMKAEAASGHVAAEVPVSATTAKPIPVASQMHMPPPQPVMTPAEYAKSRADARHFALRSFGYGTLAAVGGMGVLALLTAWWMDVSSIEELSQKLQDTIPRRTTALRAKILREETIEDELSMLPNIDRPQSDEDISAEQWWQDLKKEWGQDVEARREWHSLRDAHDKKR